ncbi:hypothetical protein pb186bvf_015852 [Paramecium bursaria]
MSKQTTQSQLSFQQTEYGAQQRLGVWANSGKNLNPQAELALAKDYNTKINQHNKVDKPVPKQNTTYDDWTRSTLKDNLDRINQLYKNNPTFKSTDPIIQQNKQVQEKNHIIKTPFSDVDNFKNINNNPTSQLTNPNSKLNYTTSQLEWKPSSKTLKVQESQSKENFERRGLKITEYQPQQRNPIIEDKQETRFGKHTSYGRIDNAESKKLLQNEYGQDLKYKEEKSMAPKCNSYSSKERTYEYKDLNEKDFRKKTSEFEQKNVFLRGK